MISACFDDSQTDPRLCLVAGLAGYANQWEFFERLWSAVLARHGVPYAHMREMAIPTGVFGKWHPPEKHEEDVTAWLKDLAGAIRDPYLQAFGSVVYIQDLERFNADKGLDLKPYSLAVCACMTQLARHYENLPVTAVFDRVEQIDERLAAARSYAEGDATPDLTRSVTTMPLPADSSFRTVSPLQAADLVVWEQRRTQASIERGRAAGHVRQKTPEQQWEEFRVWSRLNREYPLQRKSLEALIQAGLSVNLAVWDYDALLQAHDLRNGIWASVR